MKTPAVVSSNDLSPAELRTTPAAWPRLRRRVGKGIAARVSASLVSLSILVLIASPAEAQCPQGWDISGVWGLKQSNQAEPNQMTLGVQRGGVIIQGTASYRKESTRVKGVVTGNLTGDSVYMEINWSNGLTGVYSGTIGPRGKLQGTSYEKGSPSVKVSWNSTRPMICRQAPKPGMGLPPPPAQQQPQKPVETAPPPASTSTTPPFISARPTMPRAAVGESAATTTLTWDAGDDHPYAEVWVQVNNAPEYFLVEQGKGTRTVNVMPGNTYRYSLTDSGRKLATATVTPKP